MSIKVTSSDKHDIKSCPYCKGNLQKSESVTTCEACQTSLHEECAREMGRCTTVGCERAFQFPVKETDADVNKKGSQSLLGAQANKKAKPEFRVTRIGYKYSVCLTVIWTIYLAIAIGESLVHYSDFDKLLTNASMYFFVWGAFVGVLIDSLSVVVRSYTTLDEFSAKWAWLLGTRVMMAASVVAYPIGALTGSALATRIVFCFAAFISYPIFKKRFEKEVDKMNGR
ncbi:MAG: RING finger protein [Planctomycetota bacterium]|nr:RING finger protein [Planctomycetota bacterium]